MNQAPELKEFREMLNSIHIILMRLDMVKHVCPNGPLLRMKEAAKYTGRSLCVFRKEYKEGKWTSVNFPGCHPRFSAKLLDLDMKGFIQPATVSPQPRTKRSR